MKSALSTLLVVASLAACSPDAERVDRPLDESPEEAPTGQLVAFSCEGDLKVILRWANGLPELEMEGQTWLLEATESASGVRYLGPALEFWTHGEEARLSVDGEETRACTRDHHATVWATARTAGVDFRALGNEPGWRLDIREGENLSLLLDYGQRELVFEQPVHRPGNGVDEYLAESGGQSVRVIVVEQPCVDTMKGEDFSHQVTLYLDDQRFEGCGRRP